MCALAGKRDRKDPIMENLFLELSHITAFPFPYAIKKVHIDVYFPPPPRVGAGAGTLINTY